jgi:hypothetical protein
MKSSITLNYLSIEWDLIITVKESMEFKKQTNQLGVHGP